MATAAAPTYRWTPEGFLRAHEAGAFDGRVELVNGEVWPVVIGDWHGQAVFGVGSALRSAGHGFVSGATLPSRDSLPDPDCWVRRVGAQPTGRLGAKISTWHPNDVLLVVEVSDESRQADLSLKAELYGSTGYPNYWVVCPDAIYAHTHPADTGYLTRLSYRLGDRIPLPYADVEFAVSDLLDVPA